MAFTRLVLHGVGPFEHLDLDLSDGKGKSHPGPHILAGVNGSGKTTVLRALALTSSVNAASKGFPLEEFANLFWGAGQSAACAVHERVRASECAISYAPVAPGRDPAWSSVWPKHVPPPIPVKPAGAGTPMVVAHSDIAYADTRAIHADERTMVAAYSPSRALRRLGQSSPGQARPTAIERLLSFDATIDNAACQAWLRDLLSREALAAAKGLSKEPYRKTILAVERCLESLAGVPVKLTARLDPELEPCLEVGGQTLNFSQLPDGIRSVLGLVVDFLRRRESYPWEPGDIGVRPSVLLYDEIDTHLHPQWQRRVLPALREALPDVQIIVSTHSPFVISSCPGARVHVFDLDKAGHATVRQPVDAPVGTSIAATIIDIFGVESRFDIHTEFKLERWKALKQSEEAGTISGKERKALERLTSELAAQSEELRRLVSPARNIDARRIAARLEREPA